MKKIIALTMLAFIICTAFNRPNKLFSDYRDAYIGNYLCNCNCEGLRNRSNENSVISDIITVGIKRDNADSVMQITIGQNTIQAKLRNNIIQSYPSGGLVQGKFFSKDSITFVISRLGSLCNYKGKRK
jgi:hypothetical protein